MADDLNVTLKLKALDNMSRVVSGAVNKSEADFQKLQRKVQGLSDSFNTVGKASVIAGGIIGAPLVLGVKKAADFEQELSNIQAVTGATGAEMSKMKALALKEGADTKYSALEAAQGISELEKAGVSTTQVLNGGLKGALSLAAAGDIGLADAAEIASTALNAFRDDNLSVSKAADILAGAANASATSVGELKYSLSMCSAVAAGVGMNFKDTNTALALLAQNGLKGSDAGTSLKTMLMNLTPHTKKQTEAFIGLGLAQGKVIKISKSGKKTYEMTSDAFYDQNGKLKSLAEISGVLHDKLQNLNAEQRMSTLQILFGTDAIRAANILYREGANGANDMAKAMSKVTAEQTAAIKQKNLLGSLENMIGSIETVAINFGSKLIPTITMITKGIQTLVNAFGAIPEPIQSIIANTMALGSLSLITFGGIALAAGGAIKAYGSYLSCMRELSPVMNSCHKQIGQFVKGLMSSSITIKFSQKGINDFAKNAMGNLKAAFSGIIPEIKKSAKGLWEFIVLAKTNIASGFKNGLNAVKLGFVNFIPNCRKAITAVRDLDIAMSFNPVGATVAAIVAGAFVIYKYWKPLTAYYRGVIKGLKVGLAPLAPMFHKVAGSIKPVVDWFKKLIKPINSNGKAAEAFGIKVGKAMGSAITWCVKLMSALKKIITLGGLVHFGGVSAGITSKKVNGSHANGLSYVPFNGYIAELHQGERVLTKKENQGLRNGNFGSGSISLSYNPVFTGAISDTKEIKKLLEKHKRDIMAMLAETKRRKEARAYA